MADRPPPWPRRLRRRAYWLLALVSLKVAHAVPLWWGRAVWSQLAGVALTIRPRERRRALANLAVAFPEMDRGGRDRLLRESAAVLGRNFHDTLVVDKLVGDDRRIGEEPPGGLFPAMARELEKGRGLLLLTGHFGCWELMGAWVARRMAEEGLGKLAVVTGTVHNPPVDRLLQDRRRRLGLTVLPRSEGVAPLLAHLRCGGTVALLLDQNIGTQTLPVPFCGRPAPTPVGPARIAMKARVPVLPVALGWDPSLKKHEARWLPALTNDTVDGTGADPGQVEVGRFLAACNTALEVLLRRNPAGWVWFHDRWALQNREWKEAGP